jgi:hypothetical protein
MRRVIVPALLVVAMAAGSSNASAFGLFDKLCNKGACDTCCDVEPACGCEAACAPTCGCEVVDPCCDPCAKPRLGLLNRLFHKHNNGCDACEPACGIEASCGCESACAPSCGCEVADPCCDAPACGSRIKGLFSRLFHKHNDCGCDSCEPACGIEASCGCEPSCGCGN